MKLCSIASLATTLFAGTLLFSACKSKTETETVPVSLDHKALASKYFKEDAAWYVNNIPFFECSDQKIEKAYYYRWEMYKAHIRNVGPNEFVITEFITHMSWDHEPYCTINAAAMHHIYEGRWLRDNRFIETYIDNLYNKGGNNRSYSESIGDAAYANYLVNADSVSLMSHLDSMKSSYQGWLNHWEEAKQMYWIAAMPDATEFTVASIDQSGGKGGFDGGEAFRPTINSYMYANALAISRIAAMKGDAATSKEYLDKATALRKNILQNLWSDSVHHFLDRFKADNQYVKYWTFIRNMELAGMIPWYFDVPDNDPKYPAEWKHVLDTNYLRGPYGLRTNEPAYQWYMHQFIFTFGKPSSQWNGPSWPYQSSQVITGMANLLNDYQQSTVTNSDYLKLLREFTNQHYLNDSVINLVENYDANKGEPIVFYYWSNHYNHSTYNNLIISGLCGIRPSAGDTLDIHPLVDSSISYFALDNLLYHGHELSLFYDRDGTKYGLGKGLTAFVDGKKADLWQSNDKYKVRIGAPIISKPIVDPTNYALNIWKKGFPTPSASVNTITDTLYKGIDGKIWYFPEVQNVWSTEGSTAKEDWYQVDFGKGQELSSIKLYLCNDGKRFTLPDSLSIQYQSGNQWLSPKMTKQTPEKLIGNTVNKFEFEKIVADKVRIVFKHPNGQVALTELECY
jgi:hypothetical protein